MFLRFLLFVFPIVPFRQILNKFICILKMPYNMFKRLFAKNLQIFFVSRIA